MNLIPIWQRLSRFPAGPKLFSVLLGRKIPYSGTMGATVSHLEPGKAQVTLKDRRKVRNHLNSIHAVALMNLCELTSGLAMVAGLSSSLRAILIGFRIEYGKKARGTLTANAQCHVPTEPEKIEQIIEVTVQNAAGETVCRAWATWLVSPVEKRK